MADQLEHIGKEFFCAMCLEWINCSKVGFHMEGSHNRPNRNNPRTDQRDWTFERLQEHYGMLGGLDIRDVPIKTKEEQKKENFFNIR